MLKVETNSPTETIEFGEKLGNKLKPGDIVCLQGSLGAGKTVLAKGICAGLGVIEEITSPTYNVINEYRGDLKVNHIDLYRTHTKEELLDIGFEEYLYGDGVSLVEWPDKAGVLMPDSYLDIHLQGEEDTREIRLIPQANKFISLITELKENVNFGNR